MKMWKLLGIMVFLLMVITPALAQTEPFEETYFSEGDFTAELLSDGTLRITSINRDNYHKNHYVIPETIMGRPVSDLAHYLFGEYLTAYSVVIPNSVSISSANPFMWSHLTDIIVRRIIPRWRRSTGC